MRTPKILVEYNGELISLLELAERTGINRKTLQARYAANLRGEALIAPPVRTGGKRVEGRAPRLSKDCATAREMSDLRRENEQSKFQRSLSIRERQEQRRREMQAEHQRAFSQPLISSELLTDQEREEIRERVKGRQRWYQFSL
jgi:hypothetical protein